MGNKSASLRSNSKSGDDRDESAEGSTKDVKDEIATASLSDHANDTSTEVLHKETTINECPADQKQATGPPLTSTTIGELPCMNPEVQEPFETRAEPTQRNGALDSNVTDERTTFPPKITSASQPSACSEEQEQVKNISNSSTLHGEHLSRSCATVKEEAHVHVHTDSQFLNDQTSMTDDQLVAKFREHAARYYLKDYCHIMTNPWEIDNTEDPETFLDRYFVNLSLWREEIDIGQVIKIPLERSHNQLFDPDFTGIKPNRILVFGEGGTGKSTLCKKLAYDWAKRTADSPLDDVPVLCVVEFRKLQESEDIVDAIHSQLLPKDSDITPDHIRKYIKSNPSKVIIVLDGFDEFDPNTHQGDIKDLLNCKIMADVTVLVTTRPWHACLLQKKKRMYVQICLEGFDDRAVETYVRKYFSNSHKAGQCMKRIRASRIAHYYARTPILLTMICFLQKVCSEDEGEIQTLNSLFEKFLRAVYVNFWLKETNTRCTGLSQSSRVDMRTFDEFWGSLGELALKGIVSPGKRLVFSIDDIRGIEDACEKAIKMGLIVQQKVPLTKRYALESPKFTFSFPHFLFQEKCAGDYLATHNHILDSTLRNSVSNEEEALFMQYTLAFSSGKRWHEENEENRERAQKIIKHLADIQKEFESMQFEEYSYLMNETLAIQNLHGNRRLFLLGILVNYESQSADRLLKDIMRLDQQGLVQYYNGMLYDSLIYFLKFASSNDEIRLQRCDQVVMENDIDNIPLSTVLPLVCVAFKNVDQVMCYSTADIRVPEVPVADFERLSDKMSQISSLDLCKTTSPVNIHDMLYFLASNHVALSMLSVTRCPVLIQIPDAEKLEAAVYSKKSALKSIEVKYVPHEIALLELFQLTALMCPHLNELVISGEELLLSRHFETDLFLTKKSSLQEIKFLYINNLVSFMDLVSLITFMCPRMRSCTIQAMTLDIPFHHTSFGLQLTEYEEQCTLQELTMDMVKISNVKGSLSIIPVLTGVAKLCPLLKVLNLNVMSLITADMDFCMNVTDLRTKEKLQIETLEITNNYYRVSLAEFLRITAILCPNLKRCKLSRLALHIPKYDRLFGTLIVEKSSIEVLEMSHIESQHDVTELQVLCGMLCPNLKSCTLNGADVQLYT